VSRPLPVDAAADRVRDYATWTVFSPTAGDVLAAIAIRKRSKIRFWDAMVVQAAAESGCPVLWTEDLNDGQIIKGVRVRNPFTAGV
jgi:predicted nucleic acid-binding protein